MLAHLPSSSSQSQLLMEIASSTLTENVETHTQLPPVIIPPASDNQRVLETKAEVNEEEIGRTLELIASTGRFWCDWNHLRNMLSYKLKQVLSEYPEASMSDDPQIFALGETIPELLNRLDNELLKFDDGAPFTLQRICEILLAAQGIYPKLSKLVLALEKNLLVTSTLAISCDSPPMTTSNPEEPKLVEPEKESEAASVQEVSVANGVDIAAEVKDEIMVEVEEGDGDVNDDMTIESEAAEAIEAKTEAPNPIINPNSNL